MTSDSKTAIQDRSSSAQQSLRSRIRRSFGTFIKVVLPQSWMRKIQNFRAYDEQERTLFLKIRLHHAVQRPSLKKAHLPKPVRSVLFVCFGNIMRSPMCEALLARSLAEKPCSKIDVQSAGLHAAPGREAHPWAIIAARELGISLSGHKARLLTANMVEQADVIFVMDYQNLVQLLRKFPNTGKEKVILFGVFAGDSFSRSEIADPYYEGQEGTLECYRILDRCVQNLVLRLVSQSAK